MEDGTIEDIFLTPSAIVEGKTAIHEANCIKLWFERGRENIKMFLTYLQETIQPM